MDNAFLSPRYLTIANEIMDWARTYLMAPNAGMQRPGVNQHVCPYVEASISNDSFYIVFHPEVNGQRDEPIQRIMLEYIDRFKETPPFGQSEQLRKALMVVFAEIPAERTYVLDIAQAKVKSTFVQAGLMAGQFHQNCDERSVHNRGFHVSISPYPLIAIRHMAIHDIIFLKDNEEWFTAYNNRYGELFREPNRLEDYTKPLVGPYLDAKGKYLKK
jgi:heptaprenyl diphosphate synthase